MVNCGNCGAAMRLDAGKECLVCDFCGAVDFPEPDADGVCVLGDKTGLTCPVCAIPLVEAAVAGRPLLHCERCRGLLIGMDLFLNLIDALRAKSHPTEPPHPFDRRDLGRSIRCPQCGGRMDAHPYAGPGALVIDSCSRCRLNWLDHSELRRIVTAPEGEADDDHWCPLPPPRSGYFSDTDQ